MQFKHWIYGLITFFVTINKILPITLIILNMYIYLWNCVIYLHILLFLFILLFLY